MPTETELPALKPCHHCKHADVEVRSRIDLGFGYVRCNICGAQGPVAETALEAIFLWNRRPAEDALREALEAALKPLRFFVAAICVPSPGWEAIHAAMQSTAEGTALDDALAAVAKAEEVLR